MIWAKLKALLLSVMICLISTPAYYFMCKSFLTMPIKNSNNAGALILVIGFIFMFAVAHLIVHIGFTIYSLMVFNGRVKLSSLILKRNDDAVAIFKVCTYIIMSYYLFLVCDGFISGEKHLWYGAIAVLAAIAVTVLYTLWIVSIVYERQEKRLCEIEHSENPQEAYLLYQQSKVDNYGCAAILFGITGLLAPFGVAVSLMGRHIARKNNLNVNLCVAGVVISVLASVSLLFCAILFLIYEYIMWGA